MTDLDPDEGRRLAASVREFLDWAHRGWSADDHNAVSRLVSQHLGDNDERSVVSRTWPAFEHVNLQTALDAWRAQDGHDVVVQGFALPPHFGGISLQNVVSGEGMPPLTLCAPALVDLPNGPDSTLACLRLALLLVTDGSDRYVVMVVGPSEHEPQFRLDVVGLEVSAVQALFGELEQLRSALNVYRGQLLEVASNAFGSVGLQFASLPPTERTDVVLPEHVLGRVERHAFGVAEHREALLQAGQHLKRGLLLYGPPGTGKTHTTRYVVTHMDGYTRLLLAGRSLHLIGSVAEFARELEPAVIVLEDVDLVAEDRSFMHGGNPVLFELLDTMDGAAADADLLFLLTTNRADLLERALAARPGRVDVAIEIGLPDADARRRLIELYGRSVPLRLNEDELGAVVERTEGVTASFLKELLRRAVLEALRDSPRLTDVTNEHMTRAVDDLLDSAQELTRTLLGVGVDPRDLPPGLGAPAPGPMPGGFTAYSSTMSVRRHFGRG